MKKTKGKVFVAAVLSVLLMVSLAIAVPPGSQPLPLDNTVPVAWPDIKLLYVAAIVANSGATTPSAGDQVNIRCEYYICGCLQKSSYSNRVDIDGALFYEKEDPLQQGRGTPPNCAPGNCFSWVFYGGTWTATSGSHTITCKLDSKNDILEGPVNENNNTQSITVNVPFVVPVMVPENIRDIKTKPPIPEPVPGVK